MGIVWLDPLSAGEGADLQRDKAQVKRWVREHRGELRELAHLAEEREVEAIKVIEGEQEIDEGGTITLRTLELHFMRDLVLVLRSEEVQQRGSPKTSKTTVQLGYIPPHRCQDDVCSSCGGNKKGN